jgi:hypothetical protein
MIQTGDPTGQFVTDLRIRCDQPLINDWTLLGTGKGGQSIWGSPFADEIRPTLKVSFNVAYLVLSESDRAFIQFSWSSRVRKRWPGYQQIAGERPSR